MLYLFQLTSNIFGYILELWVLHNNTVFQLLQSNSNDLQALTVALDNSLLTLKGKNYIYTVILT